MPTQTFKLSASSLKLMEECPRCFWLENVKGIHRPSGPFPSLPSGMDRILKVHFDSFMKKSKLPPEIKEECKGCKLFDDAKLLEEWRNSRKGLWFEDESGNVLHGGVDNLLVKEKKIIVLDYKTRGYPLKEDTAESSQLQLDIYNFLLRKMGYETEDYAFLLFYIPNRVLESGEVVFDSELVKMKINVDNAEKVWKSAIKLLNGSCPKKHEGEEECEWCKLMEE